MNSNRSSGRHGRFQGWRIGLLLMLLAACSGGTQENHHPLLASNWGGTAGGPIAGRLEVQVFDDTTRFPYPGLLVSLGGSGKVTARTNNQGIALFNGVSGPQDIHVYACAGCDAEASNPTIPLLYQIASLYQVNASQVSIPIIPGEPAFSEGTFQGKVFDVARDETAYLAALDELGRFRIQGPLGSTVFQWVSAESAPDAPAPTDLTFVYTRDLDEWAALDPAAGKQGFNQVALVGKAINGSKQAQAGIRVSARYFLGIDAGRAYYFNEAGQIDPALDATTGDGRFVFLRLAPNNDLFLSAEQLGVGVGARYVHIAAGGTTLFTLPVLPIVERSVDLSGRVVVYRPDFQEEERRGPLSSRNVGVEEVIINFSGDPIEQSLTADSGPEIGGSYRTQGHLLPNSRYIAVILAGRNFRQTYQELRFNTRSKTNYPLAVVTLNQLVEMIRQAKGDNTSGVAPETAEILVRMVEPDQNGRIDPNGDPIVAPVTGAKISVVDESGVEVSNRVYLNDGGTVDLCPTGVTSCTRTETSASGGFLAFDLAPGVYTVIAVDGNGKTIGRQSLPVYKNGIHLVELVKTPGEIQLGTVHDVGGNAIPSIALSLVGGRPDCPQLEGCALSAAGAYSVRIDQRTGGGDYSIPVSGSKRSLGLSAFRVSPDGSLNNITFRAGLGPLSAGGRLSNDIFFAPSPTLVETTGSITLPPHFVPSDLRAVLIGAVASRGEAFVGTDPAIFPGKATPDFRALSLRAEGALSYFAIAIARNSQGESSQVHVQGLSDIPARQDMTLADPPRLLAPAPNEEIVVKVTTETEGTDPTLVVLDAPSPHLVWAPPEGGAVDFYRVTLETTDAKPIWEAWVPGNQTEIAFPAYPEGGPKGLNPFDFPEVPAAEWKPVTDKDPIVWRVEAIRAGGLSLNEFTFRQLAQQRVSVASAESRFVPRWIHNKENAP